MDTTQNIEPKLTSRNKFRWLRRSLRLLLGILFFLLLAILFVRSPWGQDLIVNKVVKYISDKTNTKIEIDKLFITFDGDLQLDGLYLEDKKGDTLVYSKSLQANVPLWKMIKGEAVGVDALDWDGLRANIIRKDSISGYNFQFLIDAFVNTDTTTVSIDSASTPLNLVIENLNLTHVDIVFNDALIGIDSRFKIGELKVDMETTDIENMIFDASEIELSNSKIKFVQNPVAIDTSTSNVPLPKFSSESLKLNNVIAYFESQPDQIIVDADIKDFYTEMPQINLENNDFSLNLIRLKNSEIVVNTETLEQTKEDAKSNINTFKWPQLKVHIAKIDLEKNQIDYRVGNAKPKKNTFNPNAIALKNLTLKAETIILKDQEANLKLNQLLFNEISGLNLKQLALDFRATDSEMRLENMNIRVNDNAVTGFAVLQYSSLKQLINAPETTRVSANLPSFRLSIKELFKLQPELKNNPYFITLSKKQLTGNINASGTLASINLPNTNIFWGDNTHISVKGTLQNVTHPESLEFDIPKFSIATTRADVIQFINEQEFGINLPENIALEGNLKGNPLALASNTKLTTTQGIVSFDGNFKNINSISYDALVNIEEYKLNELLNNPQFGTLSLSLKSQGSGSTLNTLDATLEATISQFELSNYTIKNLELQGKIKNGEGKVLSNYRDENLNINLDAFAVLDSIAPKIKAELDIIGANLQGLGLTQRNIKTGLKILATYKGNSETYDLTTSIEDGVFVYNNRSYLLGRLDAIAHVARDTTSLSISNKILNLNLKSNSDPQTFIKALESHIFSYLYRKEVLLDSVLNPVNLKLEGKISQSPLLNDVFLVNVKDLDTITVSVDFNEKVRKLNANIRAPHINYSGNEVDSLAFSMTTDKENFNFNLGFKNIKAGPLDVPKTIITGSQTNNELSLNFLSYHEGETLMNINTKITGNPERLVFKVNPDNLILNKRKWSIPNTNEAVLTKNNLEFNNFKLFKDDQTVEFTDKLANITTSHLAIDYGNFKISELFNYLNPNSKLATGQLNGDFVLENPFGQTGIIADLRIENLEVLKTDLGTLSLNGNSLSDSDYAFNVGLKGGNIDFDLVGDYTITSTSANLNLDLNLNEFQMKALNTLTLGEIENADGSFNGKFKVTGTSTNPIYNGILNFNDAKFNVAKLNTKFILQNETLNVNNDGFSMSNFTVLDENSNALVVSGEIGTENFLNPKFDLKLNATDFQILNATQDDNEDLYGRATFNADATLTGDLQLPKLDAELTLGSETNLTYVLPAAYASVEERNGVVVFVNRENPNAILTQTEQQTATITGLDISTLIKINKDAEVTVVIDKKTGDNFRASGTGELLFNMAPNGRITLTGGYEISSGHYELNLYNLVNRKFLIAPGSRVTWSGDPFDAALDVRAIYNLETSASSLMATQISGADPSVKNKFKQVLPFNVYLNIDGELLAPEISFALDMPEEERGAIGGQVYARVQQVNAQEGELNKQVFSLLVLNRFYPDSGSDGSTGGFATIAKDNLNDAVSQQLNAFSNKLLGSSGIELDFGINSYTDYQGESATDRTQLDVAAQKKLFNDRLIVRVGSEVDLQGSSPTGEATPLIGNMSLEYILSEDGRYRLRGFRKSEFENVIDGQTIVSGIALIFTQEFNKFNELWDAIFKSKSEKKDQLQTDKKTTVEKNKEQEDASKDIEQKKTKN